MLINPSGATKLERIPLGNGDIDEAQLQNWLFSHPTLIPVDDIEPVFGPLIPVARELPTPCGFLDLLYVSRDGFPTLVETKLWRNHEARREVVAQLMDYATQFARWSYADLVEAVRKVRQDVEAPDPLVRIARDWDDGLDERRFVDTLAKNLRLGRMLLLIIGDGIQESVEQLAQAVGGAPQLRFTMGLVEMALYRISGAPQSIFVQPRLVTRTSEVVRAVVEIRSEVPGLNIQVKLPVQESKPSSQSRVNLTEDGFFEAYQEKNSPDAAIRLRGFFSEIQEIGAELEYKASSVSLVYYDPISGQRFVFGFIKPDGTVDFWYLRGKVRKAGIGDHVAEDYINSLVKIVPDSRPLFRETKDGDLRTNILINDRDVTAEELLNKPDQWRSAIETMIGAIRKIQEDGH